MLQGQFSAICLLRKPEVVVVAVAVAVAVAVVVVVVVVVGRKVIRRDAPTAKVAVRIDITSFLQAERPEWKIGRNLTLPQSLSAVTLPTPG